MAAAFVPTIRIQAEDFDTAAEIRHLTAGRTDCGAVVTFTGLCRDEDGRLVRIAKTEDIVQKPGATGIHLPSPSYWPIILSAGLPFIGYGVIFDYWWAVLGGLITVAGFLGWILEPSTDPEDHHADHGHGGHDAHQLEAGEEQPALVGSTDAPAAEASNEETSGD